MKAKKDYIYLLENYNGDIPLYKIGFSNNLKNRKSTLQTGNPEEIYILYKFETKHNRKVETVLHNFFNYKRVLGEWFNLDVEEVNSFMKLCEKIENNFDLLKKEFEM